MLQDEGLDVDTLIGEVARRHNVLLAPDDPIFALLTLNELVVSRYVEVIVAKIDDARQLAAAERAETIATTKKVAESLITGGADYLVKEARNAGTDLASALTRAAAAERARIDEAARDTRRVIWWSAFAVAITASLLVGAFLASLALSVPKEQSLRRSFVTGTETSR